jgi:hypothetical protein
LSGVSREQGLVKEDSDTLIKVTQGGREEGKIKRETKEETQE